MTDQTAHDVTDDDRRLARKWAESIESATNSVESTTNPWSDRALAAARVILDTVPAPVLPTLADMTPGERAACRWMQADVVNRRVRYVIANPFDEDDEIALIDHDGDICWLSPEYVTPRPDLPRMEWPGDTPTGPDRPTVGTVIESADDPRLSALPVGSILSDCDGENVAKRHGEWVGLGYIPIPSEGTEFGPWTVLHIPKEADQ